MAWTDDRIDDAVARMDRSFERIDRNFERVDRNFERVDRNFERVWDELGALRAELGSRIDAVRSDLAAFQRQVLQMSWMLALLLIGQFVAVMVTR